MSQTKALSQSAPQVLSRSTEIEQPQGAQITQNTPPAEQHVPIRAEPHVFRQIQETREQLHRLSDATVKFHNKSLDAKFLDDIIPTKGKLSGTAQAALALMKAKFLEANITMAELDAKNLQDIVYAKNVDPVVKNCIEAQHKLRAALVLYSEETGIDVTKHVRMCDNRASEILNFIGTMMQHVTDEGLPEHLHGQKIVDALNVSSLDMHGNEQLAQHLHNEISTLYANIEGLEHSKNMMQENDFTLMMQDLTRNIQEAFAKLHSVKQGLAVKDHGSNLTMHFDQKTFNAIDVALNAAQKRLDLLKNSSVKENIADMLKDLEATYKGPDKQLIKSLGKVNKKMKDALLTHYKNVDAVFALLKKQPINQAKVLEALHKIEAHVEANVIISGEFHHDLAIAQKSDPTVYNNKIAKMRAQNEKSINDRIQNLITPLHALERQKPGVTNSLKFSWYPSLKKECQRIFDFINTNPKDQHKSGEYISMAFHGPVNVATLVELKLRNLPLRNVALDAIDAHLEETTSLGQGAANEVHLCKYTSDTGQKAEYVFKAEMAAKKGIDGLLVRKLGYADAVYFNNLNVATTEVAERIGCGSAIAKSSLGMHKGQFGLFMEFAQGKTIASHLLNPETSIYKLLNRNVTLKNLQGILSLDEQRVFVASLAKELTKLEWADALTGQVDRHRGNYLFAFDPKTCQVKITGIDNDASFSKEMVGLSKMHMAGKEEVTDLAKPKNLRQCLVLNGLRGVNQMFKPLYITEETHDALLNLTTEEYRELLQDRVPEEEMESAIKRLDEAKEHAAALKKEGKCLSDADWNSKAFFTNLNDTMLKQATDLPIYQQNFIARDFYDLMPMMLELKHFTT